MVFADDEITRQLVNGDVIIDDSQIVAGGGRRTVGPTNRPFTYTFRSKTVRKFDPTIRQWVDETIYPAGTVVAAGYEDVVIVSVPEISANVS
jgi:hypothetical protein